MFSRDEIKCEVSTLPSPVRFCLLRSMICLGIIIGLVSGCQETSPPSTKAPLLISSYLSTRGAFLGVWGEPALSPEQEDGRVWFAGGVKDQTTQNINSLIALYDPSGEGGTINLHHEAPQGGLLWWVWGSGRPNEVWVSGEGGQILSLVGQEERTNAWDQEVVDLNDEMLEKLIIWGLWGSVSPTGQLVVWAVGGSVRRGGPKGILLQRGQDKIWRRVNQELLPVEDPDDPLIGGNLYKIWGDGDKVWLVGEGSLVLEAKLDWTQTEPQLTEWHTQPLQSERPELIFTVAGDNTQSDNICAVGGYAQGQAWCRLTSEGTDEWKPLPVDGAPPLNGIAIHADQTWGVGQRGSIYRWQMTSDLTQINQPERWLLEAGESITLHSVWLSPTGTPWIVGGDLDELDQGVILTPSNWDEGRPQARFMSW